MSDSTSSVRVRFAPSPSGELHVGGARTALFNWLFARKHDGKFILRFEDTDENRSDPELIDPIKESFVWLGIPWDEGPFFQLERLPVHQAAVQKLLDEDKAYKCYCSSELLSEKRDAAQKAKQNYKYDRTCRNLSAQEVSEREAQGLPSVVRLKVDETGHEVIQDIVLGELKFSYDEVDDFIIQRPNGIPIYNFVVAVDDADMDISHVIRAKEHQKNTLRQILVYRALGREIPQFAHVPMVLAKDRSKLSKRHGATAVFEYRDRGILPEALVNYLVRLGWSHGDDEIFSVDELIEKFTLEAVHSSDAVFDEEKLLWLNHHYIMNGDPERLGHLVKSLASDNDTTPVETWITFVQLMKERCRTLIEFVVTAQPYLDNEIALYDQKSVDKFLTSDKVPILQRLADALADLSADQFKVETLDQVVRSALDAGGYKLKEAAQPCRIALTGVPTGPGLFELMAFIGKDRVVERLRSAVQLIENSTNSSTS